MPLINESMFFVTTVEEILSLQDQSFIQSAYVNLLGREPDEDGLIHYLTLWRSGFSKIHILTALYFSKEGQLFIKKRKKLAKKNKGVAPVIIGLGKAVTRYKRGHYFLVGPFFRLLYKCDRDKAIDRQLRALQIYMESEAHWHQLLYARAPALISTVYQGLLGRYPEPEAIQLYSNLLSEKQDLLPLLIGVASSDEHWHQLLNARVPALISTVYQGLLGRYPEPEAIQLYSNLLSEKQDLLPLLIGVAGSDEHWQFIKHKRTTEFVHIVFQGLLCREPDQEALLSYTKYLLETKDYPAFLRGVVNSEEFKNLQNNAAEALAQTENNRVALKNKPNYGRT